MATKKITELASANSMANNDLFVIVSDPAGSPITKKITLNNLFANITVNAIFGNTITLAATGKINAGGGVGTNNNILMSTGTGVKWSDSVYANAFNIANSSVVANSSGLYANIATVTGKFNVGAPAGVNFGNTAMIEIDGNANNYQQIVIQNANSGPNASGDLVITADNGNDSTFYVDFGINSSTYSNALYGIVGFNDGYIYSSNSNLSVGSAAVNGSVIFHAGGTLTTDKKLIINSSAIAVNTNVAFIAPLATRANNDPGVPGQICWDDGYIYVCTATNTWKRATLNTF